MDVRLQGNDLERSEGGGVSDTPRTDAAVAEVMRRCLGEYHLEGGDYVDAEFARALERELLAAASSAGFSEKTS